MQRVKEENIFDPVKKRGGFLTRTGLAAIVVVVKSAASF